MKVVVLWLLFVCAASAQAVQTYTYTGNLFDTGNPDFRTHFVTVEFTLMDALAIGDTNLLETPNLVAGSFLASVGTTTDTSFSLTLDEVEGNEDTTAWIRISSNGEITGWNIAFRTGLAEDDPNVDLIFTCASGPVDGKDCSTEMVRDLFDRAPLFEGQSNVADSPGVWNVVPEPSTLSLSALGLSGFGAMRRLNPDLSKA